MKVREYLCGGKTPEALKSELGIQFHRHGAYPDLVLFNYDQINSPPDHPIVTECRGLILDASDNWSVVSRPYDRFFNHGDAKAAPIDWTTARVYEKLDGTLCTLYPYRGQWMVSTTGRADASGPVGHPDDPNSMSFANLFWKVWKELGYGLPDPEQSPRCYMFELMTPMNRVVVSHQRNRLVLTGTRSLLPPYKESACEPKAQAMGWEYARSFPLTSFADVVQNCSALNPVEQEGFVVCDASFHRVKVKNPKYVAISLLKERASPRRLLLLAMANEGDELVTYFPEFRDPYTAIKARLDDYVRQQEAVYETIRGIVDQKAFAKAASTYPFSGSLFALRSGKASSVREHLQQMPPYRLEAALGLSSD